MKTVFVNIRMTPEMRDTIQQLADKECRSLTGQITYMLSSHIKPVSNSIKIEKVSMPSGVSEQTWADFKSLRTAKKAPVTERAIDGIYKEASKAGMTLESALRECCARGWTGFKAEWVEKGIKETSALLQPSKHILEM
jgi:hypothetical protein